MTKDQILECLRKTEGFVSGQQISDQLDLSRAAVWKAVQSLREDGYEIDSVTNRGYRLHAATARLQEREILRALGEHPWAKTVTVLSSVDSTNTLAKKLAAEGAPHGTVIMADQQTGGRGRQGRSFLSLPSVGVYLSVLLRPKTTPEGLMHLTAMTAVAACNAVEQVAGIRPGIKWTNDLVIGRKKTAGILTELSLEAESGTVDYAIIGIGVNCNHTEEDFPPDLRPIATSIRQETGKPVNRNLLAASLIRELARAEREMFSKKSAWMKAYAAGCITIGQDVKILRGGTVRFAHADGVDEDAALLVTYDDGTKAAVSSGEVSVRGMYGYL